MDECMIEWSNTLGSICKYKNLWRPGLQARCIMNTGSGAEAERSVTKFESKEIRYRHKIILGLFSKLDKKVQIPVQSQ